MNSYISDWFQEHSPILSVDTDDPVMYIGEAARITKLSESALRKYEAAGLIVFYRTKTNRRMVSFEDIERIRKIQYLVKTKGLNIEGILRIWALIPCWELKECFPDHRQNCPATVSSERPCWVLHQHKGCAVIPSCSKCVVYRFSIYCTEDLKPLLHDTFRTRGKSQ
ncbi:MerR family transcriptional regulator [bacterium]|nr:MerR family transcriptional regulator [bacterium]